MLRQRLVVAGKLDGAGSSLHPLQQRVKLPLKQAHLGREGVQLRVRIVPKTCQHVVRHFVFLFDLDSPLNFDVLELLDVGCTLFLLAFFGSYYLLHMLTLFDLGVG